jgi:hypothetical protein
MVVCEGEGRLRVRGGGRPKPRVGLNNPRDITPVIANDYIRLIVSFVVHYFSLSTLYNDKKCAMRALILCDLQCFESNKQRALRSDLQCFESNKQRVLRSELWYHAFHCCFRPVCTT